MSGELIEVLREKIRLLDRMQSHLIFSQNDVRKWWQVDAPFDRWNDQQLVSLAALKARFAELQDHLASAMNVVASIENQDTRVFTYVLNYMTQIGVLDDMGDWQKIRDLRNAATHDYTEPDAIKAQHFDQLLQQADFLYAVLYKLKQFIYLTYPESSKKS
ncbi:MAG: hypothetical protein EPN14_01925 [Gallionella sp.]|nr:MAG: hypothetical protein EPN14_01925 [Gallionella sp.]